MAARSVLASMARPRSRSGNSNRAAATRAEEVSSNGVAAASAAEGANKLFMGRCPGEREREEPPGCSLWTPPAQTRPGHPLTLAAGPVGPAPRPGTGRSTPNGLAIDFNEG